MKMESFIKFPRGLLELPEFSGMSVEAKLLFALILDRTGVSEMNSGRFTDKQGNLFVIYTLDEICGKLGCSKPTAVKVLKELQEREMIEKKREGAGKASKIIVPTDAVEMVKQNVVFSETSGLGDVTPPAAEQKSAKKADECCD